MTNEWSTRFNVPGRHGSITPQRVVYWPIKSSLLIDAPLMLSPLTSIESEVNF